MGLPGSLFTEPQRSTWAKWLPLATLPLILLFAWNLGAAAKILGMVIVLAMMAEAATDFLVEPRAPGLALRLRVPIRVLLYAAAGWTLMLAIQG